MNKTYRYLLAAVVSVTLGVILIPKLSFQIKEKPRLMKTIIEMDRIRALVNEYKGSCGHYPSKIASYENLQEQVKSKRCSDDNGLANSDFQDKWGNTYTYTSSQNSFRILSPGHEWIEATEQQSATVIKESE